jgi:hypothetical protein
MRSRSSARASPASVGEKSFSSGTSPGPQAEMMAPVVWRYSDWRNGSPRRGRWYFTDGTATRAPLRVRSPAVRTNAR